MKNIINSSIAALFALSFTPSASAVTIVSYTTSGSSYAPNDFADNLQPTTSFVPAAGSGLSQQGDQLRGWGTAIDLQKYAGFKISADLGFELEIDLFNFRSRGTTSTFFPQGDTLSFQWGYRIDLNNDGSFGDVGEEWVLDRSYSPGDSDFTSTLAKQWDVDIRTTGTVEFGFFGAAATATDGAITARTAEVIGNVNAVPEPSAVLLSALGSLALLRRRRK
ncbi:PEP-CTERM sorting domain-containing protein [Luteolibacter algae]|uniref:PEP-CTERM sorting domain-containing protein n=1 Tax=Luteolibacter algae TaxID=454151 RepID=A0ABW5DCR2_9BACT